jgi:hypothetical protein
VNRGVLEDLIRGAHRVVSSKPPTRRRARPAGGRRAARASRLTRARS